MVSKAESQDLEFVTNFAVNVPGSLRTDVRRMQQILYNLLGIALKFRNPGGTVQLKLDVVSSTDIPQVIQSTQSNRAR